MGQDRLPPPDPTRWCAGRSILTYECRTGTTDLDSRREMSRYWWLIRPFVGYILRAVLRTIRANAEMATRA